jgi:hypothetical protein
MPLAVRAQMERLQQKEQGVPASTWLSLLQGEVFFTGA